MDIMYFDPDRNNLRLKHIIKALKANTFWGIG